MSRTILSMALLSAVLSTPALAVTLVTPALQPGTTDFFDCNIVNVSSHDVLVESISQMDNNGVPITSVTNVTLAPGAIVRWDHTGSSNTRYCRFVVNGSRNSVRASAAIAAGHNIVSVDAR